MQRGAFESLIGNLPKTLWTEYFTWGGGGEPRRDWLYHTLQGRKKKDSRGHYEGFWP